LTLKLTVLLLTCIFVVAPTLTTFFRIFVPALPEKELLAIGLSGLLFGVYLLVVRQLQLGVIASFFVLMTVRVNVPMGPSSSLLGGIGPNLWLVYVPLVGLLGYYALNEERSSFHHAHYLYFGFVVWSGLAAIFGATPRADMAVWFTLWVLQAGLVFVLASWLVASGLVTFRTGLSVVALTTIAHVLFGILQFLNGEMLGFPHLGEANRVAVGTISLGPLGIYSIGAFVNGLTYGGALSVLIALTLPIVVVLAGRATGHERFVYAGSVIPIALVQRATGWDAARGGTLLGSLVLAIGLIIWHRKSLTQFATNVRKATATVILIVTGLTAILLPGSESGSTSTHNVRPPSAGSASADSVSASSAFGKESLNIYLPSVDSLSVPLFDASNLGIRLQQYLIAVDITIHYPLFGIGGANFYYISDDLGFQTNYFMHSMYFGVLLETGVPGFILYVAALCLVLLAGFRLLHNDEADTLLVAGVIAGLLGSAGTLFWNPQMTRLAAFFPFWAVAGLLVGYSQR
jgi:hypothetical protein